MLATRTDPPLPLSRWRARDQMLEVRTNQLRATEEEATALLHQVIGITLESPLLQEITARTEGWLACGSSALRCKAVLTRPAYWKGHVGAIATSWTM